MGNTRFSVSFWLTIAVIAMALSHAFTIGYGTGFQSRGRALLALQKAKQHSQKYAPSLLTVHYERQTTPRRIFCDWRLIPLIVLSARMPSLMR